MRMSTPLQIWWLWPVNVLLYPERLTVLKNWHYDNCFNDEGLHDLVMECAADARSWSHTVCTEGNVSAYERWQDLHETFYWFLTHFHHTLSNKATEYNVKYKIYYNATEIHPFWLLFSIFMINLLWLIGYTVTVCNILYRTGHPH
jgi:hypothetical protein